MPGGTKEVKEGLSSIVIGFIDVYWLQSQASPVTFPNGLHESVRVRKSRTVSHKAKKPGSALGCSAKDNNATGEAPGVWCIRPRNAWVRRVSKCCDPTCADAMLCNTLGQAATFRAVTFCLSGATDLASSFHWGLNWSNLETITELVACLVYWKCAPKSRAHGAKTQPASLNWDLWLDSVAQKYVFAGSMVRSRAVKNWRMLENHVQWSLDHCWEVQRCQHMTRSGLGFQHVPSNGRKACWLPSWHKLTSCNLRHTLCTIFVVVQWLHGWQTVVPFDVALHSMHGALVGVHQSGGRLPLVEVLGGC